jgi:hypothetical protein
VVFVGLTHQLDCGFHAQSFWIDNLEAKLSCVALRQEWESKQTKSELKQPAQDFERGNFHDISRARDGRITKGIIAWQIKAWQIEFSSLFTKSRQVGDKTEHRVGQFLNRSAVGRFWARPKLDRKLQAFRHREGMGKTGARTAGGTSASFAFRPLPAAGGARLATAVAAKAGRSNLSQLLQF